MDGIIKSFIVGVNSVKANALYTRIFRHRFLVCKICKSSLSQVRWLTRGNVLTRIVQLKVVLYKMRNQNIKA